MKRLLGQFLDGFVSGVPLLCAAIAIVLAPGIGVYLLILGVLWALFYAFFADGLHEGQSIAKQWLGMRVLDAKSGRPCTFSQSFVRNLLLTVLGPIDWVFIFGEQHQRLGDKAAGTIVVAE